jgi:hypothetical protein
MYRTGSTSEIIILPAGMLESRKEFFIRIEGQEKNAL